MVVKNVVLDISITWQLVRNANLSPHPDLLSLDSQGWALQVILTRGDVWEPLVDTLSVLMYMFIAGEKDGGARC